MEELCGIPAPGKQSCAPLSPWQGVFEGTSPKCSQQSPFASCSFLLLLWARSLASFSRAARKPSSSQESWWRFRRGKKKANFIKMEKKTVIPRVLLNDFLIKANTKGMFQQLKWLSQAVTTMVMPPLRMCTPALLQLLPRGKQTGLL